MTNRQLAELVRTYAQVHKKLALKEHAAALEKLAAVLDKLPKAASVTKALKKVK